MKTFISGKTAFLLGIAAGFIFLIGLLAGTGKGTAIILPCAVTAGIILVAVSLMLNSNPSKPVKKN